MSPRLQSACVGALLASILIACPSASAPEPPTPEPTPEDVLVPERLFQSTAYRSPVLAGDLTGDGLPNLVVLSGANTISVLGPPVGPAPTVVTSADFAGSSVAPSLIRGSLNDDAIDDLFLHNASTGELMLWYGPLSDPLSDPDWVLRAGGTGFGRAGTLIDIDDDGDRDLLVAPGCGPDGVGPVLFRMPITSGPIEASDADTVFTDESAAQGACDGRFVDVFDANADGALDVMIGNAQGEARIYFGPIADGEIVQDDADVTLGGSGEDTWFWNDGRGVPAGALFGYGQPGEFVAVGMAFVPGPITAPFISPADSASIWIVPSDALRPAYVAAGDWDGDGETDAALAVVGAAEVAVVLGPLGAASARIDVRIPLDLSDGTVLFGDVNGDGRDELIVGSGELPLEVYGLQSSLTSKSPMSESYPSTTRK